MRSRTVFLTLVLLGAAAVTVRAADLHSMPGMDMHHEHGAMSVPAAPPASAPARAGPAPKVTVASTTEEGKRMIAVTVTLNSKPLEGAKVNFLVERSFGWLSIGKDDTDDAGTAAVKFPAGLPGGGNGMLHVVAQVAPAARYGAASGEAVIAADTIVQPDPDPFPRALWAPRAPIPLILTLAVALGGVWTTYLFVISQLKALHKEGTHS